MENIKLSISMSIIILALSTATYIMSIVIIIYTFKMLKRIDFLENTIPTNIKIISKNNKTLYKMVEKLFETKARNEMEKEDNKSFINKLSYYVQTNDENITTLFKNNEINNDNITSLFVIDKMNDENIKTQFENITNDINRLSMYV